VPYRPMITKSGLTRPSSLARDQPTWTSMTIPCPRSTRPMTSLAVVAALLAFGAPVAVAGGGARTAIVLLPPQPVTSPPTGYIPQPIPNYPPQGGAPVGPMQPLPPQVTYFTPPQAVPVIIPGGHGR
jgi:hypothetical protein